MNAETSARLVLLNSIESGSQFWTQEVKNKGALHVVDQIKKGKAYSDKKTIEKVKKKVESVDPIAASRHIAESGALFIDPHHELWPTQLNDLANPPFGIIIKGDFDVLSKLDNSVSIVGTRNPTNYGLRIASDFAAGLFENGLAVVSGGAVGIDAAAHKGALAVEGTTLGVLGGGVNKPYPLSNFKLFDEIRLKGLLISEVMPNINPIPLRFLIRNRLIAALSKGTLVVEAAFRSGSLRTARDAAEIFRPVMAIPGPINVPTSEGCHKLITERCAELVTSVSEVLELVNPLTRMMG